MGLIERVYARLPIIMQNGVCSIYGFLEGRKRYSASFYRYLDHFTETEWYSAIKLNDYKNSKLSEVLIRAKKTKYYGDYLVNVSLDDISSNPYSALEKIPISSKEDVINSFDKIELLSDEKSYIVKTSGTTGKALRVLKTKLDFSVQWAIWMRHRRRFGVELGDVSVNFTGKSVVPINQISPPFWRYNAAQKQYLINMQHINEQNIVELVAFLNSIQPKFYSGYPSIIAELARLALSKKLPLLKETAPDIIFCGAENTLDYQVEAISKWTNAKVTDQYGLTEGNCNLSKCDKGYYHEDFEFSHFEIMDPEYLEGGRIRGRLIGTGFYNMNFPLIRYDTGDVATMMPEDYSCECGRQSRVLEAVEGRIDDYVITTDNKHIMRFDYLFKDTFDIKEVQVIQRSLGSITILSVLRNNVNKIQYESLISKRLSELINSPMKVDFEYTNRIKKSNTGKFKAVLSLINENSL